ncbi:hypothetical protein [Burkholderia multivorans]|uniref:hypothetical protein n=1 Tax=Burkholderia multivorans TaxID=87883 RepID=UPI00158D39F9|nr:hypothetical protein [Burkholderia multivorans]
MTSTPTFPNHIDASVLQNEADAARTAVDYADWRDLRGPYRQQAIDRAAAWYHGGHEAAPETLTRVALWRVLEREFRFAPRISA